MRKAAFRIGLAMAALTLALGGWASAKFFRTIAVVKASGIPTTVVKRGDVPFTVAAKGELQGSNTEMLYAPMTGGGALAIRELRESGELVKEGDIVVQFDTTEQEFKLREAEAD